MASRHDLKLIRSRAALAPLNFHSNVENLRILFEWFCGWKLTSLLTRCLLSNRELSECARPTSTWITT